MGLVTSKKTVGGVSLRGLWAGRVVVMEVGSVKRCDLRRLLVLFFLFLFFFFLQPNFVIKK